MRYIPQSETLLTPDEARQQNPLVLAFVGDSVQQLYVRTKLACEHSAKAGQLHNMASKEVKATTQARIAEIILPQLSEEEGDVYRRARNSKTSTIAKNASYSEYKKASGLEAVLGYLYLIGSNERLAQLLTVATEEKGESNE